VLTPGRAGERGKAVARQLLVSVIATVSVGIVGCASTWDKVTSRDFKEQPFETLFGKMPDPLHVLRTSPEGTERAKAMKLLQEPLRTGGSQADQDEVLEHILGPAATSDPSPVVRAAAIEALGRFDDPRALPLLIAAYHHADGREPTSPSLTPTTVAPANAEKEPGRLSDRLGLHGPSGYPAEVTAMLRIKALQSLAQSGQAAAVGFLADVAAGKVTAEGAAPDRDTRLAAIRGLSRIRTQESVLALARVLEDEQSRDIALAGRAHQGLIELTGENLPADPSAWNQLLQAGVTVAPEANPVERAVSWLFR